MASQLVLTGVIQVPPIANDKAQVRVSFKLLGILPDFVQIYAAPAGGGVSSGQLMDTVEVKPPEMNYTEIVTLAAGTYYAIYACPRTGDQSNPDDQTDDQPWESYCAVQYITTKNLASGPDELVPPVITNLNPKPATMSQGNRITVVWSSPTHYDKFVVGWTQNGTEMAPQEVTSGSWDAPTVPKWSYTFRVNGGISQFWNYRYSAWGSTAAITAVSNLTSLRKYLLSSGINPAGRSLRSLVAAGQTLRKFMKLS